MPFSRLTRILFCTLTATAPAALAAQSAPVAINASASVEGSGGAASAESDASDSSSDVDLSNTALARGRYAVVIDLSVNVLSFRKGDETLWSAPIGTGTGLSMHDGDQSWNFSTPDGIFHVQFKEENPVWIAPDWFFLENKLPVPPPNDKKRYFPGGLGSAAVYITPDMAIHGTDKPELLGQRVSHGCIRLANAYAERLFHDVQIGTEVIIVGGRRPDEEPPTVENTFDPEPKKQPKDPVLEGWKKMDSQDLLAVLDNELWLDSDITRWPEVASILLDRGLTSEDDEALAGLFATAANLPNARVEHEYDAFLADAYSRGPQRTVDVLGGLDRDARRRAATAIVTATMELFHGDFDDPTAPWPTRRIPGSAREDLSTVGWHALASAEADFQARGEKQTI
jgi:lipoprotein-anchoring transpeptidase ErfK/SrfK